MTALTDPLITRTLILVYVAFGLGVLVLVLVVLTRRKGRRK